MSRSLLILQMIIFAVPILILFSPFFYSYPHFVLILCNISVFEWVFFKVIFSLWSDIVS